MKNKITPEEVKHIAKLANLPLGTSEVKKYAKQQAIFVFKSNEENLGNHCGQILI